MLFNRKFAKSCIFRPLIVTFSYFFGLLYCESSFELQCSDKHKRIIPQRLCFYWGLFCSYPNAYLFSSCRQPHVVFLHCIVFTPSNCVRFVITPICFVECACVSLDLFRYTGVKSNFHIICSFCLPVTLRVPLVEKELLSLPEHHTSSRYGSCCSSFSFL